MTSKEKIKEIEDFIDFLEEKCIITSSDTAKTRLNLNTILKDLERLEQIDNAKPSEALEILETFNGGLLNKEIGAISYNQIWLKNQIEALKQALLKAQEQDKILDILKKCEDEKHSLYCVYVLNALSSGKITQDDVIEIKEWLDGK